MKYWYLLLCFLTACDQPIRRVATIHDYIFKEATDRCAKHEGLHYVVTDNTILYKGPRNEYPCSDLYYVRCQDNSLFKLNSGTTFCFISEDQIEETLREVKK